MNKGWLIILIFTFIVFLSWLIFDIYHARPSTPITDKLQAALEPLNPTFDQRIITQIQSIQSTTPIATPRPSPLPSPQPSLSPTPISTVSAQPTI